MPKLFKGRRKEGNAGKTLRADSLNSSYVSSEPSFDADSTRAVVNKNLGMVDKIPHKSAQTSTSRVDIAQPDRSQDWMRKCLAESATTETLFRASAERVSLHAFAQLQHPNKRVAKAQEKLQESTEMLEATLRKYADKFQQFPTIGEELVKSAMDIACSNQSGSGEVFGKFIEGVLAGQEQQKGAISGKVASCMAKVYPVACLALGLVSSGAGVSHIQPSIKLNLTWLTGCWILASRHHCQWSWPSICSMSLHRL
jgi:hypothetical protein